MMMQRLFLASGLLAAALIATSASALELDWGGQFRAEANFIHNYSMDSGNLLTDTNRAAAGGYYIPGGGSTNANFQTLFMRLQPKLVVNDNIYIKSEFHLGDPVFGFFGDAFPYSFDQRQFYSTQSRGSLITANRFWAELLTDVGTVQVGRAPLNWGLGIVWNAGDGMFDRYQSTGDVIRMVSKFGAFAFTPSIIKYDTGNNLSGSCIAGPSGCVPAAGGGGVSDYSLAVNYENTDEDFSAGVNFIKRIAGPSQDPASGILFNGTPSGMKYNTYDFFGRKKWGRISLAGELPITDGDIGGVDYQSYALALETDWHITDMWETLLKVGHAPGQPSVVGSPDKFRAFYFNPNYSLGLIMFHYNLRAFAGPNTQNNPTVSPASLASPYDKPVTDANYALLGGAMHVDKWDFRGNFLYARAVDTATAGRSFWNNDLRRFVTNNTGENQSDSLGWELDLGTSFHWDDAFLFNLDMGAYLPGDFYKYSNTSTPNATDPVLAAAIGAGIQF